jgi:hypothetical protein
MARGKSVDDVTTLQMALVGYQMERQKIDEKIRELQAQLRGRGAATRGNRPSQGGGGTKRNLSPAARRRIAEAQKRRWAEHRKKQAQAGKS